MDSDLLDYTDDELFELLAAATAALADHERETGRVDRRDLVAKRVVIWNEFRRRGLPLPPGDPGFYGCRLRTPDPNDMTRVGEESQDPGDWPT